MEIMAQLYSCGTGDHCHVCIDEFCNERVVGTGSAGRDYAELESWQTLDRMAASELRTLRTGSVAKGW